MKVFTTLNPNGNFEAQNEAMSSWSLKYDVYSVNTKEEIERIKDIYPYINFIETNNLYIDGKKKLIKLNAILDAIKQIGNEYNCIVNSDIILSSIDDINTNNFIDDLIIATRYELVDDLITEPFINGFDVFIFNIKNIDKFYNDNYVIGMPWWDFWIPTIAITYNLKVYHIDNTIFLHRTHPTNYSDENWVKFGELFYIDVFLKIMKYPIKATVYDICTNVKIFIDKKLIKINI